MKRHSGFTLLELITVIIIIFILATIIIPVVARMKRKAQRVHCIANLKSLNVAVSLYMGDNKHWPQIFYNSDQEEKTAALDFAHSWVDALKPFGPTPQTWVCPTIQAEEGNPDLALTENARLDYIPTEFGSGPMTPFRYSTHPWFVERANVHGGGNLVSYPDGSIQALNDLLPAK